MIPQRSLFFVALVILSLALIGAGAAHAEAGLNLTWGAHCPTGPYPTFEASDPCDGSTLRMSR